jgi:CCR4-NOT transcription complex subunit 4
MFPPSRQPSLASTSRLERPGTPTSEIISDNASITSASMSRASSPPPAKVGSAPVRTTTKSMQKKQRKEAQKEKEKSELEAAAAKPEPEAEIAPIMGRKKKQRKEKPINSATGGSTPAASRPPSPEPVDEEMKSLPEALEQTGPAPEKLASAEQELNQPTGRAPDLKGKGKNKTIRPTTPELVSNFAEDEDEVVEKPIPTPASILQELISSGAIEDAAKLNILKHPNVSFRHQDQPLDFQNANHKLTITPEDRAALLSGLPVHKVAEGPNRIMLTPNGDCVRNLTPEEEERYLELQAHIAEEAGPTAFFSAKHQASNGFTLIGGRAVPNGPPAFFPLAHGNATPMDPVSKIQRDEALSYINQYVLPSLSTNSQLEKALNANALDAEMLRSGDASTWTSWGSDPAAPHPENGEGPYGAHHHEGILASGLENMTAHFAVGRDIARGQPLGNVSLLSQSEAESALQMARKETESLEKKLNTLLKKNRRLLLGSGH